MWLFCYACNVTKTVSCGLVCRYYYSYVWSSTISLSVESRCRYVAISKKFLLCYIAMPFLYFCKLLHHASLVNLNDLMLPLIYFYRTNQYALSRGKVQHLIASNATIHKAKLLFRWTFYPSMKRHFLFSQGPSIYSFYSCYWFQNCDLKHGYAAFE